MYREDLAQIHHAGFCDPARDAAPALLARLRAAGLAGGLVVDLGCGAGSWLRELDRAGFAALGVDRSRAFLRMARRVAPRATLRLGDLDHVDLPPCAAVTALGEVLAYRSPGARRRRDLARLFWKIASALRPGGLLIFDLPVVGHGPDMTYRTWRDGPSWAVLIDSREERAARRVTREITTFRKLEGRWRRGHEGHVLDLFPRREVEAALRAAGFTVRVGRAHGAAVLPPRRLAFRARRRR